MPFPIARTIAAALILAAAMPGAAQDSPPLLHSIFQDHAVLQRDRPIAIWGRAAPGETVRAEIAGNSASAQADKSGIWQVTLPALPAGGPFTLTATSGERRQSVADVLIGDVWLCSGQSNMEFPVSRALNGGFANLANDPQTRLLTVRKETAPQAKYEFPSPVSWQAVTPQSIADFSAACWFMASDLRESEKVPFGLINDSWGGTAIDPWRSEASFGKTAEEREGLALLNSYKRSPAKAAATYGTQWGNWWRGATGDKAGSEPWAPGAAGEWRAVPSFTPWEGWGDPELAAYNGIVWYRTEVSLTAKQAAMPATLLLGIVDDLDMSFVNGTGVGATASWDAVRTYPLEKGTLHAGVNRITVAATDNYGPGGMTGTAEQRAIRFADGSILPLPAASGWQYRVTPGIGGAPHAPWEAISGMAGIYNAMVAPLGQYGLRGVAWYQGESDAGAAEGYAQKLGALIAAWRGQFANAELPFVVVQLADYGARNAQPVESGFARIRDEQRRAAEADPKVAIAVAVDLGEPSDIHPANKQSVGQRMARAARAIAYAGTEPASGPRPIGLTRGDGGVSVNFADVQGALVAWNGAPLGFELCKGADGACTFLPAAELRERSILLPTSAARPGDRIRYCWGDSPVCNVSDGSGIPASPFEMTID